MGSEQDEHQCMNLSIDNKKKSRVNVCECLSCTSQSRSVQLQILKNTTTVYNKNHLSLICRTNHLSLKTPPLTNRMFFHPSPVASYSKNSRRFFCVNPHENFMFVKKRRFFANQALKKGFFSLSLLFPTLKIKLFWGPLQTKNDNNCLASTPQ